MFHAYAVHLYICTLYICALICGCSFLCLYSGSHSISDRSITVQAVPQTVIRTTIAGSKAHNHDGQSERRPTVTTSSAASLGAQASAHKNAIPFRDPVLQFCEKHLDKIKLYIESLSSRLALPIKATLEGTQASIKAMITSF